MIRSIFVNLPVKNLTRSVEFFTGIGFSFNQQFTDENGAMIIINDNASVMLLTDKFFQSFSKKPIGDAIKSPEVIVAFSAPSKEDIDSLVAKVEKAGGKVVDNIEELGGAMYGIRFEDLDHHLWEAIYMDMTAMSK